MCNCLFPLIELHFQRQLARSHPLSLVSVSKTTPVQLLEPTREITTFYCLNVSPSLICFLGRSIGAVALLYDLSCLSHSPVFGDVQNIAYELWKASPANIKPPLTTSFMGNHYFVTSPSGTGLSPVWDYRAGVAKGNADAFVLAAKVADVPAPTSPQDVDWLQLKSVSGSLATQVCAMFCNIYVCVS